MKKDKALSAIVKERWPIPTEDLVPAPQNKKQKNLDYSRLRTIVETNAQKINDAKGIMELLPDLNLVREILIASIMSPKDLMDVDLKIQVSRQAPPSTAEVIRQHFSTVYDLNSKLSTILGTALFDEGSHPLLTIPPRAVHEMITRNTTAVESINEPLPNIGLLSVPASKDFALESVGSKVSKPEKLLSISDNCLELLNPHIQSACSSQKVSDTLASVYGLEGIVEDNPELSVYLKRKTREVPKESIDMGTPTMEDYNPFNLSLPPESVIPVTVPGEPENHVGYFVVIAGDGSGSPIHKSRDSNYFSELNKRLEATVQQGSGISITGLGVDIGSNADYVQPMIDSYIETLETTLSESVSNGTHGRKVEVRAPTEIYRIMFARQLAQQRTKLLYVPAAMMTYVAFNYNSLGIGESLLERTKLYASLRAIIMFAEVMAGIKSSVPGRTLNITLDEDDPDHQGTVETVLNEFIALQTSSLPTGKLSATDIIDALQRSGVQVQVDGGDSLPGTNISVDENPRDVRINDNDISDKLKYSHYAGLWVSPEEIDRSLEGDLATGIVYNNLMRAKRVMSTQRKYEGFLSRFIKQNIWAGGELHTKLQELYKEIDGGTGFTFEDLVDSITVDLPKPDTAAIRNQRESYDEYLDFITEAVKLYVSEDLVANLEIDNEITASLEDIQMSIIALLVRQYMRNQNMLPELDTLLNDIDSNVGESIKQHNEAVLILSQAVIKSIDKSKNSKLPEPEPEEEVADAVAPDDTTDSESEAPADDTADPDAGDDTGGTDDAFSDF